MSSGLKSCYTCVNRLNRGDAVAEFGQDIGGSVCGRGHGPVFVPLYTDRQNEQVGETKADKCADYMHEDMRPVPERKPLSGTIIMLPDPIVRGRSEGKQPDIIIKSCLQCANYVPADQMVEAGLWNVGACAARGIAVGKRDVVNTATACAFRTLGPRDESSIARMTLAPEYTASTIGRLTTAADFAKEAEVKYVEPTSYPTDKEVSDDDKKLGIRAWRAVEDPEKNGPVVYLPIFDLDHFDEVERSAIPRTGDDEHPEEYVDHMGLVYKAAVLWMHLNETPALWGVAGTGKTEFYRYMAWLMVIPFNRFSFNASSEVEDMAGKMHFDPSRGTYFEYGRIPNAWRKPGVICLDEPNVAPPDVWQFIRPLTDNSKQLVLDMNNGERISRHAHAFLGLAMNPAWDVRNSGTVTLADADGSRLMHIFVELPTPAVERKIILDRCKVDGFDIPPEKLDMVMSIARELRALCDNDTLPITWGIRPQIKVARALQFFSVSTAYRLATADYLEPEQQQIIMDVVKSHRPHGMAPVPPANLTRNPR